MGFVVSLLAHQGLNWQHPRSLHHWTCPLCLVPVSQQVLAEQTDGKLASIFSVLGLLEEVFELRRLAGAGRTARVEVSSLSALSACSRSTDSRAAEPSTVSAVGAALSGDGGPWHRPDMAAPPVAEISELSVGVSHAGGWCHSPDPASLVCMQAASAV